VTEADELSFRAEQPKVHVSTLQLVLLI